MLRLTEELDEAGCHHIMRGFLGKSLLLICLETYCGLLGRGSQFSRSVIGRHLPVRELVYLPETSSSLGTDYLRPRGAHDLMGGQPLRSCTFWSQWLVLYSHIFRVCTFVMHGVRRPSAGRWVPQQAWHKINVSPESMQHDEGTFTFK